MDKYGMARHHTSRMNSQRKSQRRAQRLFGAWAVFCGFVTTATIVGVIWLIVYVLPHIVAALDRIH